MEAGARPSRPPRPRRRGALAWPPPSSPCRGAAPPIPGSTAKVSYQIVSLKIDDAILGGKGLTHLRVGFAVRSGAAGAAAGPELRVGVGGVIADPRLEVGQEGCFFLARHH